MDKKYWVIAKVQDGTFVKHRVNNLVNYAAHLNREHGGWRYMNVFRYTSAGDGPQIANYTRNNPPRTPHVQL